MDRWWHGSRGRKHGVGGCFGGEVTCHLGSCDVWHSLQTVAASAAPELNFSLGSARLNGKQLYFSLVRGMKGA